MQIAEKLISALEEFNNANPTTPLLISFDAEDVRKQAAASTQRFEEGNTLVNCNCVFSSFFALIDLISHDYVRVLLR